MPPGLSPQKQDSETQRREIACLVPHSRVVNRAWSLESGRTWFKSQLSVAPVWCAIMTIAISMPLLWTSKELARTVWGT